MSYNTQGYDESPSVPGNFHSAPPQQMMAQSPMHPPSSSNMFESPIPQASQQQPQTPQPPSFEQPPVHPSPTDASQTSLSASAVSDCCNLQLFTC